VRGGGEKGGDEEKKNRVFTNSHMHPPKCTSMHVGQVGRGGKGGQEKKLFLQTTVCIPLSVQACILGGWRGEGRKKSQIAGKPCQFQLEKRYGNICRHR